MTLQPNVIARLNQLDGKYRIRHVNHITNPAPAGDHWAVHAVFTNTVGVNDFLLDTFATHGDAIDFVVAKLGELEVLAS